MSKQDRPAARLDAVRAFRGLTDEPPRKGSTAKRRCTRPPPHNKVPTMALGKLKASD